MCDVTFIARSSDGLLLAEAWSPHFSSSSSSNLQQPQEQQQLKQQVKQVLQRLQGDSVNGAIEAGNLRFYYKLRRGITYLTVCAASYPRRLAVCFLDDVCTLFEDELSVSFGSRGAVDAFSMVETIEAPYHFLKFERVIQKKRQEYGDPVSSRSLARLNESLAEVSDIMKQNIEEILQRGENLSDVGKKATDLKYASEKFKGLAKSLSFRAMLQQYAPLALVVLFMLLLIVRFLYF